VLRLSKRVVHPRELQTQVLNGHSLRGSGKKPQHCITGLTLELGNRGTAMEGRIALVEFTSVGAGGAHMDDRGL
jgi:hypothetical protein